MPQSLENQFISDEFHTLLHTDRPNLSGADVTPIYDGDGNKSAIRLNSETGSLGGGIGLVVSGTLSSNDYNTHSYPASAGEVDSILVSSGASKNFRLDTLNNLLGIGIDADGNADELPTAGTYYNPTITINSKGIVTHVATGADSRTFVLRSSITDGQLPPEPIADAEGNTFLTAVWPYRDRAGIVSGHINDVALVQVYIRGKIEDTISTWLVTTGIFHRTANTDGWRLVSTQGVGYQQSPRPYLQDLNRS